MKKIIVRIAEGIGNQLFMYANAYALSKKNSAKLYIDNTSGYFKKKNQFRSYELDKFNINSELCSETDVFNTFFLDVKRKLLKKTDFFRKDKLFYIEHIESDKKTKFHDFIYEFKNKLYVEGYFQSEKYFSNYINDFRKQFTVKPNYLYSENKYTHLLKNSNSVSICIRQNRFSEGKIKKKNKSNQFTLDTIDYINRSIDYLKKKLSNPKFFIWSDNFTNLDNHFNKKEFVFIINDENKSLNDFNLFQYSKHFIVGPTPFHWWGAWLNSNPDKICIRPSNLNPSNNVNFWPENWISI